MNSRHMRQRHGRSSVRIQLQLYSTPSTLDFPIRTPALRSQNLYLQAFTSLSYFIKYLPRQYLSIYFNYCMWHLLDFNLFQVRLRASLIPCSLPISS